MTLCSQYCEAAQTTRMKARTLMPPRRTPARHARRRPTRSCPSSYECQSAWRRAQQLADTRPRFGTAVHQTLTTGLPARCSPFRCLCGPLPAARVTCTRERWCTCQGQPASTPHAHRVEAEAHEVRTAAAYGHQSLDQRDVCDSNAAVTGAQHECHSTSHAFDNTVLTVEVEDHALIERCTATRPR